MSEYRHLASASDNEPVINRAFAAYFRSAAREGGAADQPASDSHLCELDGRQYVVLVNAGGVLAVYRVRTDGILKAMKRWPKELEEW